MIKYKTLMQAVMERTQKQEQTLLEQHAMPSVPTPIAPAPPQHKGWFDFDCGCARRRKAIKEHIGKLKDKLLK